MYQTFFTMLGSRIRATWISSERPSHLATAPIESWYHSNILLCTKLTHLTFWFSRLQVANKYSCNKGMLQSLQQSASTFAGMVTQFCRKLGWSGIEPLVSQFCARLEFGVQAELVAILQVPIVIWIIKKKHQQYIWFSSLFSRTVSYSLLSAHPKRQNILC